MRDVAYWLGVLKDRGHRLTKIRRAVLDVLVKTPAPLSVLRLQARLGQKKLPANKTTVYRELAFLAVQGVVRELQLGSNAKAYELMPDDHHHHLVCLNCAQIEHIKMPHDLDKFELSLAKTKNFKVERHTLEFYGLCVKCQ